MANGKSLPDLWLISDERNDAALERALGAMPRGSGFIYRHYHLDDADRFERFKELHGIVRRHDHTVVLSDSAQTAAEWGAHGTYGPPRARWPRRRSLIHIATAHNLQEIGLASRIGAHAILLSPVFPTRSHPGGRSLGPVRFRMLAQWARVPVIALGGMDADRARALQLSRWAAIDGLS